MHGGCGSRYIREIGSRCRDDRSWPRLRRRWRRRRRRGGGAGDESRAVDERPPAQETSLLDEDEDCFRSRAPVRLYRGGPFSTGPWLEPVLKGL